MTFSILALVLARDFHIKPDSEAGGLIWVEEHIGINFVTE
jgi:hypothetical protein